MWIGIVPSFQPEPLIDSLVFGNYGFVLCLFLLPRRLCLTWNRLCSLQVYLFVHWCWCYRLPRILFNVPLRHHSVVLSKEDSICHTQDTKKYLELCSTLNPDGLLVAEPAKRTNFISVLL
jgi:hypothetical protein